jgi:membrane protease YdiL (CAAX protease family)
VDTTLVSVPILIGFAVGLFLTIKGSVYPFKAYGLTTENWRYAVKDSLLWTVPLLVLIVAFKALLVYTAEPFEGLPILDFYRSRNTTLEMTLLAAFLYAAFVPIQEGVARCGLQSSLQMFLTGRYRVLEAILLSNMLFSATHLHVSVKLALLVFPVGVFWGWLYYRHKTVIGVIVSHIIVGLFGLFVVGFSTN